MSFIASALNLSAPGAATTAKIVEVVAVLAIASGAVATFAHHERGIELTKLQRSSTKLIAQANDTIAQETAQHAKDNAENAARRTSDLAAVGALTASLGDSVRGFDAYRRAHPDVSRPAGGSGAAPVGECGDRSCGDLVAELAERGNVLAGSTGELRAELQSCQRDRDSLTGLPR